MAWTTATGGCAGGEGGEAARTRLSIVESLSGSDTVGYARAMRPRPFDFPADHGPHPDFRTEWWYVTGNLRSTEGRAFGFQVTIFRSALAPTPPDLPSAWATNQAYMAHFALTDVDGASFQAHERFARGAMGLAGAAASPFRVWVGDWELRGGADDPFPIRLTASEGDAALDLLVERGKPPVAQGDAGLSRKGPEPGNASYYYSLTRMPASGTVRIAGDTLAVEGEAWLDREWSTSALSADQVGWDWFSLQLDDGWELMAYVLRHEDGSPDPFSAAVLVDPAGRTFPLAWGEGITADVAGSWSSPIDGASYPSGWRIRVPSRGWTLDVDPALPDQELNLSFRYWEGAVRVSGAGEGGFPVSGHGYVELTGYAGAAPGR